MQTQDNYTIKLENFEGPLEFLLYLAQKNELDITDVRLRLITEQFIKELQNAPLDVGAEFVGTLAALLWLKSRMLLPKHEQAMAGIEDEGPDPHFDVIHQLIEYCRFKEAGKELSHREQQQNAYYARGCGGNVEVKKPLGIEHLSLEDFATLFQDIIIKAKAHGGTIHEEEFRVSDKIRLVKTLLKMREQIPFSELFSTEMCKEELIVTFLAILELMKIGVAAVAKVAATGAIIVMAATPDGGMDEQRN
jgi:segregation and condensation protein A